MLAQLSFPEALMSLAHHVRNLVSVTSTDHYSARRTVEPVLRACDKCEFLYPSILRSNDLSPFSPLCDLKKHKLVIASVMSPFVRPTILTVS